MSLIIAFILLAIAFIVLCYVTFICEKNNPAEPMYPYVTIEDSRTKEEIMREVNLKYYQRKRQEQIQRQQKIIVEYFSIYQCFKSFPELSFSIDEILRMVYPRYELFQIKYILKKMQQEELLKYNNITNEYKLVIE